MTSIDVYNAYGELEYTEEYMIVGDQQVIRVVDSAGTPMTETYIELGTGMIQKIVEYRYGFIDRITIPDYRREENRLIMRTYDYDEETEDIGDLLEVTVTEIDTERVRLVERYEDGQLVEYTRYEYQPYP